MVIKNIDLQSTNCCYTYTIAGTRDWANLLEIVAVGYWTGEKALNHSKGCILVSYLSLKTSLLLGKKIAKATLFAEGFYGTQKTPLWKVYTYAMD